MATLHIVDYAPFIRAQRDVLQRQREEKRLAWGSLKRKGDVDASSAIAAAAGDRRLAKLREVLDNYEGFVRSTGQRRFHEEFIKASLPHIYLSEFETHRDRILRENKMDRVRFEILVCTPRRFGKTTSVSMFCAALLATCPDMWISVFSTGQRASSALLDQTAKFFKMLTEDAFCLGGDERILKKNQEQLFTRGHTPDDVRRMFSYPSTVSGLKGVGGKVRTSILSFAHCLEHVGARGRESIVRRLNPSQILILEEAAQIDEQVRTLSNLGESMSSIRTLCITTR